MRRNLIAASILTVILISSIFGLLIRINKRAMAQSISDAPPALINTCLITNDVNRLTDFYAKVLKIRPERTGKDYVEFHTGVGVLAIFSAEAQEKYIPGSARADENHSAILQFKVGDVDQEYARLHDIVQTWVKGPTNQPWGTRSIYFRDPDGNLVDFFTMLNSA
ncbi:VOC family protein [Alloacidobacterium sp.]|uniref:VOC family protein n=1 Tax=Alloacidobacterium sp. TaxID=2951999 RepID=UPI002D718737|nr:VOC family protein [Alloacidobacterium sp.]HYK34506.1 VOC family protein [Alloacidobacterium sp.]